MTLKSKFDCVRDNVSRIIRPDVKIKDDIGSCFITPRQINRQVIRLVFMEIKDLLK